MFKKLINFSWLAIVVLTIAIFAIVRNERDMYSAHFNTPKDIQIGYPMIYAGAQCESPMYEYPYVRVCWRDGWYYDKNYSADIIDDVIKSLDNQTPIADFFQEWGLPDGYYSDHYYVYIFWGYNYIEVEKAQFSAGGMVKFYGQSAYYRKFIKQPWRGFDLHIFD